MARDLPRWVTSNAKSLRREAEPYIHLTPAERVAVLDRVCRAAVAQARSRPDASRVFAWRDPLLAESVAVLARLRAQAKNPERG